MNILVTARFDDACLEALRRYGQVTYEGFADEHRVLALPGVIATPHVGENTHEVVTHQSRIVLADLARLLEGDRPVHIVNPTVLEGFRWSEGEAP